MFNVIDQVFITFRLCSGEGFKRIPRTLTQGERWTHTKTPLSLWDRLLDKVSVYRNPSRPGTGAGAKAAAPGNGAVEVYRKGLEVSYH
jgi:hypothetical protein